MRRRDFIKVLAGSAVTWPIAARAEQHERMRRIGILNGQPSEDPAGQAQLAVFAQSLMEAGWSVGRNVQIDIRWAAGDAKLYRKYAAELVALKPDVILASNTTSVRALLEGTRSIPIVFANATDPVGGGLVASLSRPGGNVTGFSQRDFALSAKTLELLKEVAPSITRVAVLRDSTTTGGPALAAIQTAASTLEWS